MISKHYTFKQRIHRVVAIVVFDGIELNWCNFCLKSQIRILWSFQFSFENISMEIIPMKCKMQYSTSFQNDSFVDCITKRESSNFSILFHYLHIECKNYVIFKKSHSLSLSIAISVVYSVWHAERNVPDYRCSRTLLNHLCIRCRDYGLLSKIMNEKLKRLTLSEQIIKNDWTNRAKLLCAVCTLCVCIRRCRLHSSHRNHRTNVS